MSVVFGEATVLAEQKFVDVPHSFGHPPEVEMIDLTPWDELGGRKFYPSDPTKTSFRINIDDMDFSDHIFGYAIFDLPRTCVLTKIITRVDQLGKSPRLTWYKRSETGIDVETGKTTFTFTEASLVGLIENVTLEAVPLEPGVDVADVRRLRTCYLIRQFDRIVLEGELFEVGPVEERKVGDTFYFYAAILKKLKMELEA